MSWARILSQTGSLPIEKQQHSGSGYFSSLLSLCSRFYLSIWEQIAVFCNEKTITENHFDEFFKHDLQAIYDNRTVYRYLEGEDHTDVAYNNLWSLLQKTCGPR